MGLFIADAYAQGGPPASSGGFPIDIIFIVLIFAVFYFLLIRPQQKRAKEHKKMVDAISKGDEVVTNGGLLGKVTKVGDNFITLEVSEGAELHVQRTAVAALMPKGTIKAA